MCGGFTGEHEMKVHKKAEIVTIADGIIVHLWKNYKKFGTVEVQDKSIHYANNVCENWENGILTEDNTHIVRS